MKKNRLLLAALVLFSVLPLGAEDIGVIIESAKAKSPSYQNIVLTYQNGLLSVSTLEEKDKLGISVSAEVNPLSHAAETAQSSSFGVLTESATGDRAISISPSLTLTFPDDGKTEITGGATVLTRYSDGKTSVTGNAGLSHTFDFSGYDDDRADDLLYASTRYSTEMTYRQAELSFEKTVLEMIGEILSVECSVLKAEFTLERQGNAVERLKTLSQYSASSPTYINAVNVLEKARENLEALSKQHEMLLSSYRTLTGLEWDGVDISIAPVLELRTFTNGNTSVLVKSLEAESREEKYRSVLASYRPSAIRAAVDFNGGDNSACSISGSVSYTGKNWYVAVSPGVSMTSSSTEPYVTVIGAWRNDSENSKISAGGSTISGSVSENAVKTALNEAKIAENEYLDALTSYNEEASQLALKIVQWNSRYSQSRSEKEYLEALLENEKSLLDLGLSTSESVREAQVNYDAALKEWQQVMIEGLSLERDLGIFAL